MNRISLVVIIAAGLSLQAVADSQIPAYWMKKYPEATVAKQKQCMEKANEAYEKAGGTQGRGDNGFAVLAKGTAWEKCMDEKTGKGN